MSNDVVNYPDDSFDKMIEFSKENGFGFLQVVLISWGEGIFCFIAITYNLMFIYTYIKKVKTLIFY